MFFVIQEVEEFLKEPDFFVYEDRDHKSLFTRKSFDNNLVKSAGDGDGKLKRNGWYFLCWIFFLFVYNIFE